MDEPDFSLGSFLLSVLGEGSFLNLLSFLERHVPDQVTRRVAHLALQDEARHVAFGVAHLEHSVKVDPSLQGRLRLAMERRHAALSDTAGLNAEVFDALVILAAGAWTPGAIATGWGKVQTLQDEMDEGRRRRLGRLGFPPDEAADLSALIPGTSCSGRVRAIDRAEGDAIEGPAHGQPGGRHRASTLR